MVLRILKPKKALNKAYLKIKPHRSEIENFKDHLINLLNSINENESEEFHKNLVIDFLKKSYYDPRFFINTKGRNDLVIHNGKTAKTNVSVIVEAKSPINKYEMITTENLNRKAFQELVLYYLRERIAHKNIEIKHLIATNIYEWFIFDVQTFDRLFAQNKSLVKQFQDFEAGRLAETKTDFFYTEIASSFINQLQTEIPFTHFDFRDFEKPLKSNNKKDDHKLIALFKLLSPEHLLKLPFANDSNSLDKAFYSELLHIIGLTETSQGGKKLIERPLPKERYSGTLLESAIVQLDSLDVVNRMKKASQYGKNTEERLFNVALELVITWVNRILFLKLMEAQLIKYNSDPSYSFLNSKKVKNYDDLNTLFFQVLAKQKNKRNPGIEEEFKNVPYLNSSLFEPADIERNATIYISGLRDEMEIPLHHKTVLKDNFGKRKTGNLTTLQYLFEFLNAYDFSSEGSEEIQEENKTLINASVLGLIFEKINGYKDGSFFTPGFVTMFMAREAIRKSAIQKLNEIKGWNCKSIQELYNKIDDIKEANSIINSIKICDPAVGSGHFLVSSLNEMIALKNDLKILQDRKGLRLKEYQVEVVNDELIVTDEDGELFEYHPTHKESQRIQETLFHEKQTIIENCLFGVDINPNSVKICRLRLWIELLKNAYYKNKDELETLPNIDINIKQGNSLISRFSLGADLKGTLKKNKLSIEKYRASVSAYHNARTKEEKRELEDLILKIKQNFSTEIRLNDPLKNRLDKLASELYYRFTGAFLFEPEEEPYDKKNKKLKKQRACEQKKLEKEIAQLQGKIDEIKNNKVFENAFEWRFEFPEVLNDNGDFIGFDVVIANPPYIRQEELKELKNYLETSYKTYKSTADLYVYFVEKGLSILKDNGEFIYILPNKWMKANYGEELRKWLKEFKIKKIIDFRDLPVFEEATTYPAILSIIKDENQQNLIQCAEVETLNFTGSLSSYLDKRFFEVDQDLLNDVGWALIDQKAQKLIEKINGQGIPLKDLDIDIFRGIVTGLNEAFIIDEPTKNLLIEKDAKSAEIIKPILKGRNIKRYQSPQANEFLILSSRNIEIENYPAILEYLWQFKEKLEQKAGASKWYELQASPGETEKFEKPKIMYPDISKDMNFILDSGQYSVNTVYNISSESLGLLGFLNSKLFHFYYSTISNSIRGGYMRFFTDYMQTIPVPQGIEKLESTVNLIISSKKENPKADTSHLENDIDQMIYELYGLTDEETEVIENAIL